MHSSSSLTIANMQQSEFHSKLVTPPAEREKIRSAINNFFPFFFFPAMEFVLKLDFIIITKFEDGGRPFVVGGQREQVEIAGGVTKRHQELVTDWIKLHPGHTTAVLLH